MNYDNILNFYIVELNIVPIRRRIVQNSLYDIIFMYRVKNVTIRIVIEVMSVQHTTCICCKHIPHSLLYDIYHILMTDRNFENIPVTCKNVNTFYVYYQKFNKLPSTDLEIIFFKNLKIVVQGIAEKKHQYFCTICQDQVTHDNIFVKLYTCRKTCIFHKYCIGSNNLQLLTTSGCPNCRRSITV